MRITVLKNRSSKTLSFQPGEIKQGDFATHHPETGIPFDDSWNDPIEIWDVPTARESKAGIIVPYGGHEVFIEERYPSMPEGSKLIWKE
jgi:hypothetical protein